MNNYMPTKLFTGTNVIREHIDEFKIGSKCLIITGKNSAKKSGALDDVTFVLNENGITYSIYDNVIANPLISTCLEAGVLANKMKADFIIGIGGGSVLDSSKVIAMVATNPDIRKEDVYALKWNNKPLPIILVGTTSGTGSEVTKVAVITDEETGRKKSGHHDDYYAKVAFGDPRYTESLNRDITISTGIDALSHCVESYFSNKANEISKSYAIHGTKVLLKELNKLIDSSYTLSIKDRENLYNGSILGGLAINITGTTFAHNIGYYLTEEYHKPHGIACAIFMEDLLNYVERTNKEYLDGFFKEISCSINDFVFLVNRLLPSNDIKMDKKEIDTIMPRYENNNSVKNTKGRMNIDDIRSILEKKFI